ncbi:hypothetical protein [Hyalangium sp.]|uniref:hypothetical protein n=1 Tax=Hyalangium sp. TaxID=2028555 RepID=UPI002D675D07|nr:hypothetical protein [Hyalangium sp.]HYH96168.1 hypothetical protein [Hyalangium sp.]
MARGKVKVTVDVRDLKRLRDNPELVLRELDHPCRDVVRHTLDVSNFLVPRGNPTDASNLAETAFLTGPEYNLGPPLSTTWLAGYNHPAAGAIHEGFHWGAQTEKPPPHWMKKSFKGARGRARKAVAKSVAEVLRRFFPAK